MHNLISSAACLFDAVIPSRERGAFFEAQRFKVRVRFPRRKKQEAERVSRPAIVFQPFFEARFLGERLVVNRGDFGGELGRILQFGMVGLDAPLQRIDQRHRARAKIQDFQRSAAGRFDQGREFGRSDLDFFPAIRVKIELRHRLIGLCAVMERVGNRFGADQFAPQFRSQMRGIEPAENSVPVGVIALRAQQVRDRLGAPQLSLGAFSRAFSAAASQLRGDSQHFLVQADWLRHTC